AIYTSFLLSVAITVFATVIHLVTALLAGFALSIKKLPFRRLMMFLVLFTMLFSSGLIPYYLTLSSYRMVDTIWVLFLPGAVSPYSIFLTRNFISNIPDSLKEAAELDGANPFWMFIRIIVPLCVPIIATLALFCAVGKWNDWTTAAIFIKSKHELRPFVNVLQNVVVNPDPQNATGVEKGGIAFSNALIVMSIIPVTIMYLCTQRFLLKGLLVGSVKG
ncbi:MAG: carbohydrate ABC transporter permease, partial [Clostridiales bacterium]|nr:carbohydrate ABC transporter permease [Clostridiales bacterium]